MLEQLKQELVNTSKEGQRSGLCKHKSGNFSFRDKETNLVGITPAGIDREILTVDDICILDLEGNLIEVNNKDRKPSSEFMMHLEVYKNRDDIYAIAHTHSKFATSFAVLNKQIPAVIYEVATLGLKEGYIPVAKYGRPGTVELSKSVIEPSKKGDCFLLEKHGVVACAEDLENAILRAHYVEELAEIYKITLDINRGQEPDAFTQEELDAWRYPEGKKA